LTELPEAAPETRSWFIDWLDEFSACVRAVDYAAARPMFHPKIVAFGTHQNILLDREAWISTQWDNVWPKTADFRFDLTTARVLASDDASLIIVIAAWDSTGFSIDGSEFERPGRATFVFHKSGNKWLCVHSHLSLNRGVPQSSHGNRPVKAR
jgi:ketosteroid isomerase-like protein